MFQVFLSNRARKSLKRLSEKGRRRVLELLTILRDSPVPANIFDIVKMK